MSSPDEIIAKPWPKRADRRHYSAATDAGERAEAQAYNREMGDKYKSDTQEMKEEKLAVCPRFSVSLAGPESLPLNGTLRFKVTLKYEKMPDRSNQPIVASLLEFNGPIGVDPIYWGQYQIFTSGDRLVENKVDFNYKTMALRKPRDPETGRFLDPPAETFEYEVDERNGWVEMRPGQEISRELELRLDADSCWKKRFAEAGGPYYLCYAPSGTVGNPKGIERWKFGTLEEWRGVRCDTRQDDRTRITIPVESKGALRFWVTEE